MRVQVLGAGIVGLSVAHELTARGHAVEVVDPAPGSGASWAAAGMLSPSSEVWHGETEVLRLGLRSLALWPSYAASLGVPIHRTGTLLVGHDRGDLQQVERQVDLLRDLRTACGDASRSDGSVELLTGRALRSSEPTLSPRVAGGVLLPDDHSVDPRAVVAALLERLGRPALRSSERPARRTSRTTSGVAAAGATGAQDVAEGGDVTVVATGSRLPEPWSHLVRGVRGEILRGHSDDPPSRTVRGWVHGRPVYVVPRPGGDVVVGATSEEHETEPEVTLGGVFALVEAARALLPGLDRATFVEAVARDRPGTPDNLPLVGPAPGRDDVVLAAGLFRHGVLLAPLVAQLVADHLETGQVVAALDPRRFAESARVDTPGTPSRRVLTQREEIVG